MLFDLHDLAVKIQSRDELVRERLTLTFASRPRASGSPDIFFALNLVPEIPGPPRGEPVYTERDLIHYYIDENVVTAHFPRYGRLQIDLDRATVEGEIIAPAITTYGVFEDLIAIGLSPLLRRRGKFLIHAFAAAHHDRAALLVGGIGAGKTTTGIALLRAGWQLLSNDSPLLDATNGDVQSYPGLLSAYPETLRRFPELNHLIPATPERRKVTFAAESVYPGIWCERARPGVLLFPHIENHRTHHIEKLSPPEALRMLLPHAVERWDTELIPAHLALLNRLVAQTPAYKLSLAPNTETLPDLIRGLLSG